VLRKANARRLHIDLRAVELLGFPQPPAEFLPDTRVDGESRHEKFDGSRGRSRTGGRIGRLFQLFWKAQPAGVPPLRSSPGLRAGPGLWRPDRDVFVSDGDDRRAHDERSGHYRAGTGHSRTGSVHAVVAAQRQKPEVLDHVHRESVRHPTCRLISRWTFGFPGSRMPRRGRAGPSSRVVETCVPSRRHNRHSPTRSLRYVSWRAAAD
jgi:hypothetical protein